MVGTAATGKEVQPTKTLTEKLDELVNELTPAQRHQLEVLVDEQLAARKDPAATERATREMFARIRAWEQDPWNPNYANNVYGICPDGKHTARVADKPPDFVE